MLPFPDSGIFSSWISLLKDEAICILKLVWWVNELVQYLIVAIIFLHNHVSRVEVVRSLAKIEVSVVHAAEDFHRYLLVLALVEGQAALLVH